MDLLVAQTRRRAVRPSHVHHIKTPYFPACHSELVEESLSLPALECGDLRAVSLPNPCPLCHCRFRMPPALTTHQLYTIDQFPYAPTLPQSPDRIQHNYRLPITTAHLGIVSEL
jgi:hypothetical protein